MAARTVQIHPAIYRIQAPFGQGSTVYLYLVRGERLALVDTGVVDTPSVVLAPALAEVGLKLSDVEVVLVTHVHTDHTGGNREMKRISNASIHIFEGDLPAANSLEVMVEDGLASWRALGFPQEMISQREAMIRGLHGEAAGVDVVLADGDVVDLGGGVALKTVHTPGHTSGSVCYLWEKEGVLLAGDGIAGQGLAPGVLPMYTRAAAYRRSLTLVSEMAPRVLGLSHAYVGGNPINDPTRRGEEVTKFLQESVRVSEAIQSAVAAVMRQSPEAGKREIILAALAGLAYEVPLLLVRETGMPNYGAPTLLAHIEATLAGDYPS